MWMGFILQTLLIVIPISSLSESVKTSKACYGVQSPTLSCTKHTLECSSGMIAIQDAYYTNSTACTSFGLASCAINVSSIPDTGRYRDFSETQLNNLYKNCSAQRMCTFNGDRNSTINFSIVKFICINDTVTFSSTTPDNVGSSSERPDSVDGETDADEGGVAGGVADGVAGGVAGGVVAAMVVIGAVVGLVFWFKYKRNKTPRVKTGKQADNYSEVTAVSKNVYNKELTNKPRSNYDYATVANDIKTTGQVRIDNYDLARTPVGSIKTQNGDAKVIEEDEYNHIDNQMQITINGDKPSGYDTTASAVAAVRKLQNKSSSNREGDYDYNHLNSDVKPVRDDYDTAESASRAVAQMVKDKDTAEDDYDHFHKIEAKSLDSPYNTTEQCVNETDYSLAWSVNKTDPYDLAK